jgi:hypothetical protein
MDRHLFHEDDWHCSPLAPRPVLTPIPSPTLLYIPKAVRGEEAAALCRFVSRGAAAAAGHAKEALAACGRGDIMPRPGGLSPQGWIIVDGRLPKGEIVPCPSLPNHGTWVDPWGKPWIVTAAKEQGRWEERSDIWHECLHALIAPVPPFAQQSGAAQLVSLATKEAGTGLSSDDVAALLYFACETVVCALADERRDTMTGLPVAETEEVLAAALRHWHWLLPSAGFDGLPCGGSALDLLPPFLSVLPLLRRLAAAQLPPSESTLQRIVEEEAAQLP